MADENTPDISAGEMDEDISWEDAFREAAAGHSEADEAVHEPSVATTSPESGGAGQEGQDEKSEGIDIDFLLDIKLNVTVEVGRTRMLVNELLQLQQGSVIDLDKMVGEPFELYVNEKLMAFGEIVVVNEKFGVRLTDIIDPKERIAQLG